MNISSSASKARKLCVIGSPVFDQFKKKKKNINIQWNMKIGSIIVFSNVPVNAGKGLHGTKSHPGIGESF